MFGHECTVDRFRGVVLHRSTSSLDYFARSPLSTDLGSRIAFLLENLPAGFAPSKDPLSLPTADMIYAIAWQGIVENTLFQYADAMRQECASLNRQNVVDNEPMRLGADLHRKRLQNQSGVLREGLDLLQQYLAVRSSSDPSASLAEVAQQASVLVRGINACR